MASIASSFARQEKPKDDVIVYVVSGTTFSLPFGHSALEVDGTMYHLSPPGYRRESRDSYIESEQREFNYGYHRYSINYTTSEKALLKSNLQRSINAKQPYVLWGAPWADGYDYGYMNQCTTFVTQSLPDKDVLFNSLVKKQIAPAGFGWGLDTTDILSNGRTVKRLNDIPKRG
jgi:hypothetical protein